MWTQEDAKELHVLLDKRAQLTLRGQEILDTANAREGGYGGLTDDEAREHDQIMANLRPVHMAVTQLEIKREAHRSQLSNDPSTAIHIGQDMAQLANERRGPVAAPSARFADVFGAQAARDTGRFESFDEFATILHAGLWDPRLRAALDFGESGGGHLAPPAYMQRIFDGALEDEIVRPRASNFNMTTTQLHIAGIAHNAGADGPFGVSGGWTAPGETISETTPTIRALELNARGLKVLAHTINELLDDGQGVGSALETALRAGLAYQLDTAFLTGDGVGKPLGILNSPALITVAEESGQANSTIVYANLLNMMARLHPRSFSRSVWVASQTCIPQLHTLTVEVGDGGSHIPVMTKADGGYEILTRPVIFTERLPAITSTTGNDILLCDFSQYAVGMRQGVALEKSMHVGFAQDVEWYRAIVRADGLPLWSEPYVPANGDSLSPFVALGPRIT